MTGWRSTKGPLSVAGVVLLALPALGIAQDAPRTAWGEPDLQGSGISGPSRRSSVRRTLETRHF